MPHLPQQIRHRGRRYPVLDRLQVGRQQYLILKRHGRPDRERLQVYEQFPGAGGALRTVHLLPRSQRSGQLLRTLERVSQRNSSLPVILHVQQDRRQLMIVTTWVEGEDLRTFLDLAKVGKRAWPSPAVAFHRFRRFVHGLAQLHDRAHVVHGDLKPQNLILGGEPPELTMIDFGSAWCEERTVDRDPGDGISQAYAAPELRSAEFVINERCDQFSATVIFYELLTGEVPYAGLGGQAGWPEFREQAAEGFVPPSQKCRQAESLSAAVWKKIDRLVSTGLALDPQQRYPNSRAWRDGVDEIQRALQRDSELSSWNRWTLDAISWFRERLRRK